MVKKKEQKKKESGKNNKRLLSIIIGIVIVLLIPMVLQFPWSMGDYVIAGLLLLCAGLGCEYVMRKVVNVKYRVAIIIAIAALLLTVWAELAVGIFGTPFAGS